MYGNSTLNIYISSQQDIAGFQFELSGITITNVFGGFANDNDFTIDFNSNSILGFSMSGGYIPPSDGVLIQVSFSGIPSSADGICFGTDSDYNLFSSITAESISIIYPYGTCFEVFPHEITLEYHFDDCGSSCHPMEYIGIPLDIDNPTVENVFWDLVIDNPSPDDLFPVIGSHDGAALYDPSFGWMGSLTHINSWFGGWVTVQEPQSFYITGIIDPNKTTDLSMHLNQVSFSGMDGTSVPDALAGYEGSIIGVSTDGMATLYIEEYGWIGSLTQFYRNKGYFLTLTQDVPNFKWNNVQVSSQSMHNNFTYIDFSPEIGPDTDINQVFQDMIDKIEQKQKFIIPNKYKNFLKQNITSSTTMHELSCNDNEVDLHWGNCNSFPSNHSDGCMPSGCYSIDETTYLYLAYQGLGNAWGGGQTSISYNMCYLTNLEILRLEYNNLSDPLPYCLDNINYSLRVLSIAHNDLWTMGQNSYSPQPDWGIWKMTNLTSLELGGNSLTDNIPPEIGDMENLENLSLYNNDLSGQIPHEIGNLINLTNLDLYNNNLSGEIPSEIGNLVNLENLNLQENLFIFQIPEEICNQGDNSPHLTHNYLCPPYPDCLSDGSIGVQECINCASGYIQIDLPDMCYYQSDLNVLQDFIDSNEHLLNDGVHNWGLRPIDVGHQHWDGYSHWSDINKRLNILNITSETINYVGDSYPGITTVPESISNLHDLQKLNLSGNQLNTFPSNYPHWDDNLRILFLQDNNLNGELQSYFQNVSPPNFSQLRLENNQLTGEIPNSACSWIDNWHLVWGNWSDCHNEEQCSSGQPLSDLSGNKLCPPYPDCIPEPSLQNMDISNCDDDDDDDDGGSGPDRPRRWRDGRPPIK